MSDILLIAALLLAGFSTTLLINEIRKNQNAKIKELDARIQKLEEANPKRINYETLRALEDADAALDAIEREIDFDKSLVENARAHVRKARNPKNKI